MRDRVLSHCLCISLLIHVIVAVACLSQPKTIGWQVKTLQVKLVKQALSANVVTRKSLTKAAQKKSAPRPIAAKQEKPASAAEKIASHRPLQAKTQTASLSELPPAQPQAVLKAQQGRIVPELDTGNQKEAFLPAAETPEENQSQKNIDYAASAIETAEPAVFFSGPIAYTTEMAAGANNPPMYPRIARRRGWQGNVLLLAKIDKNGFVQKLRLEQSSGYALLDRTALETVRSWQFKPKYQQKQLVGYELRIPIQFELKDS